MRGKIVKVLYCVASLLAPAGLYALSMWCKTFSSGSSAYGFQVEGLPDSTFVIAGTYGAYLHLMKVDMDGNVLKERDIRVLSGDNRANALIKSPDGSLLIAGHTVSSYTSPFYALLMKLDTAFNVLWWNAERKAGSWFCVRNEYFGARFYDVMVLGNRVISVGNDENCSGNEAEGKINVYDLGTGSLLFRGAYIMPGGSYRSSDLVSVVPVSANLIYAFGGSDYPNNSRIKVLAFDTLGNVLWGRALYTSFNIRPATTLYGGKGAVRLPDGRILLLLDCRNYTSNMDAGFVILDTALSVSRAYCIQGSTHDWPNAIIEDFTPGYYVVVGRTNSYGAGGADAFMMKMDTLGNVLWFKTYGGADYDEFLDVVRTPDLGYMVVGRTRSFTGNWEIWVVKTDTAGNTCGLCAPQTHTPSKYSVSLSLTSGYTPINFTYATLSTLDTTTFNLTLSRSCAPVGDDDDLGTSERICSPVKVATVSDGVEINGRGHYIVYSASGSLIMSGKVEGRRFLKLQRGVYFLKFGGRTHRLVVVR